ncbi:MAG: hypothetical protein OEV92_02490 [Nitrospinota bacterium]|nr:hypothetical protein [Nitrospinota bacterium]
MGINNILRQLPYKTLRNCWKVTHALAEARTLDDYSQTFFHYADL